MWDILLAYLSQQNFCAISKRYLDNFSRRAACRAPGFGDVTANLNTRVKLIWPDVWLPFANDVSPFVMESSRRSTFYPASKFFKDHFHVLAALCAFEIAHCPVSISKNPEEYPPLKLQSQLVFAISNMDKIPH